MRLWRALVLFCQQRSSALCLGQAMTQWRSVRGPYYLGVGSIATYALSKQRRASLGGHHSKGSMREGRPTGPWAVELTRQWQYVAVRRKPLDPKIRSGTERGKRPSTEPEHHPDRLGRRAALRATPRRPGRRRRRQGLNLARRSLFKRLRRRRRRRHHVAVRRREAARRLGPRPALAPQAPIEAHLATDI